MKRAIFGFPTGTLLGKGSSQADSRKAASVRRYDHHTLSVAIGLGDRAGGRCRACSISLISAHVEKLLDARGGLRESAVYVAGGDVTWCCTLFWCAECSPSASPSSLRLPPPSPPSRL